MCDDSDLKDIGVPMGPRKKLISFIKDHNEKERKREELAAQAEVEQHSVLPLEPASAVVPSPIPTNNIVENVSSISWLSISPL